RRDGDRIVVSVIDTGPGFIDPATPRTASRRGGGYGLVNVRQRLEGYFGDAARLSIDRDEARGLTIVSVSLPFTSEVTPSLGTGPSTSLRTGPSTSLGTGPSTSLRTGPSTSLGTGPSTSLGTGPS